MLFSESNNLAPSSPPNKARSFRAVQESSVRPISFRAPTSDAPPFLYQAVLLTVNTCSEAFFTGITADSNLHVKLTGSWETMVGEMDTYGEFSSYGYPPVVIHMD